MSDDKNYATGSTYLIIKAVRNRYGPRGSYTLQGFTCRKTKPNVDSDEVALKLDLKLPSALFDKPLLSASIGIEGEVPIMDISPETVSTVQDLIRSQTGLDVELKVVPVEAS